MQSEFTYSAKVKKGEKYFYTTNLIRAENNPLCVKSLSV